MAKLRREHVQIAREMRDREVSGRQIAAQLGVDESTLRYRLKRPVDAPDGRQDRASVMDGWAPIVQALLERLADARVTPGTTRRVRAQLLHDLLVRVKRLPNLPSIRPFKVPTWW